MTGSVDAVCLDGERYDSGSIEGYLDAILRVATKRKQTV